MNVGVVHMPNGILRKTLSLAVTTALVASQGVEAMAPIQASGQFSASQSNLILGTLTLPAAPVTLDFQEADIRDVIRLLSAKSGINMVYGTDVTGPITVHLDQVPFDQAFQTILTLKGLVALNAGSNIIRIITSPALTNEQSQATTFTQVFRLNYLNANDVKSTIDAIRGAAGRKGVSNVDTKSNALIVTDTREGLQQIETLLPTLDRKPQQVDIEAKIVEVTLSDQTDMGIAWSFNRTAGGGNFFGAATDSKQSSISPGQGGPLSGSGAPSDPNINVAAPSLGNPYGGTGVNLSVNPASFGQVAFTFLHQEAAYALATSISALATKNKAKVLSSPHIVTLNNEAATINVVDQTPYQVSTVNQGVVSNSVAFVNPGIKLAVKPTINADRQITLKVTPEVSNAGATPFPGGPPILQTRNADTTVLLKDGETIAIGGLIKETTQKIVIGIPLLMSIPVLGNLFKTTQDIKARTELIVFLTPRIASE